MVLKPGLVSRCLRSLPSFCLSLNCSGDKKDFARLLLEQVGFDGFDCPLPPINWDFGKG